ncbi:hypothetical protein B0H16DRAFT_1689937 [Mycena metata]|uniref:F-box domain-containing protein n=1 Tax=Mycena metata TaxID=1033252 RepID=A0AAD7J4J3_9AGAR|nr:hypothetical protein B0H16DRAFT_1689937 [Mycena metata]
MALQPLDWQPSNCHRWPESSKTDAHLLLLLCEDGHNSQVDGRRAPSPSSSDGRESFQPVTILELPPEILAEILVHCLPTYSAAPAALRAPLLLGGICGEWRMIALSTPSLWSTFILPVDMGKTTDDSPVVRLFESWIARGGNYPLTMVISCSASDAGTPPPYTLPGSFISALSRSASRWHDVHLVLPHGDFHRLQANDGFPFLRRLAVKAADWRLSRPDATLPLDLFINASVLDDVFLGEGFDISDINLPLHQLSYFESHGGTAVSYFQVLCQATELREIRLNPRSVTRFEEMVHSNVKSLNLQSVDFQESEALGILDYMTCPALEKIVIGGSTPLLSHSLLRFLSRSSPPLREFILDLDHHHISDALANTNDVLMAMPALELLELKPLTAETAHDIFNRMYDKTTLFLPRLTTLRVEVTLHGVRSSSWTYATLVRMAVARWNVEADENIAQLQLFKLSFSNPHHFSRVWGNPWPQLDADSRAQLVLLDEQGMDIELMIGDDDEPPIVVDA